jgi:hypothetical protein
LRRNCLLKHVIEGKLEGRREMMGWRGRRRKQLLDDLKEKRRYWKLKEEALYLTLWRIRFGRDYGLVIKQATEWMNPTSINLNFLNRLLGLYEGAVFDRTAESSWRCCRLRELWREMWTL